MKWSNELVSKKREATAQLWRVLGILMAQFCQIFQYFKRIHTSVFYVNFPFFNAGETN